MYRSRYKIRLVNVIISLSISNKIFQVGGFMLKVIIADDEKHICNLIQKLVNWEEMNLQVIDVVHNALDAYESIVKNKPDIAICDIRMPGYTGLELIEKVQEQGVTTEFVIISGYKYFDYAHQALTLGISHYILKPISSDEINKALKEIAESKSKHDIQLTREQELCEEVLKSKRDLRKHLLTNILYENVQIENLDATNVEEPTFDKKRFCAFFIKIDYPENQVTALQSLLEILGKIVDTFFEDTDYDYINSVMKSGIMCVVNIDSDIDNIVKNIFEKVTYEIEKFGVYKLTIGVGIEVFNISEISTSITTAINAIKCRIKKGIQRIIYYNDLSYTMVDIENLFDDKTKSKLQNMIEVMDDTGFHSLAEQKRLAIQKVPFYSPIATFLLCEKITSFLIEVLEKNKVSEHLIEDVKYDMELAMDSGVSEEEMSQKCMNIVILSMRKLKELNENKNTLPIRMAQQYIQVHYKESLSLEMVSLEVNLSPAYLSTLFKKEAGVGFLDYLTSCRINAAKELLKETNDSIEVIAANVGYPNARYFSFTFLKIMGVKPTVYRKWYR